MEESRSAELAGQRMRAREKKWFARAVEWLRDATAAAQQHERKLGTYEVDRAAREMAGQRKQEVEDEHQRIRTALADGAGPASPPRTRRTRAAAPRPRRVLQRRSEGPPPRLCVGDAIEYLSESRDERCTDTVVHIERSNGPGSAWRVHTQREECEQPPSAPPPCFGLLTGRLAQAGP